MDEADSSCLQKTEMSKSMEARIFRVALVAAVLLVSMGARHRTPNFIIEARDAKLAQQVGQAAEKYRRELAIEWLGKAMPKWSQPCVTTVRVGPRLGAGGATTFVFDRGEVFGWRMNIQGSHQRLLDSVLPHEILHTILASHFRRPLPRWADEGAASSVEHLSERAKHHRMLQKFLRTGHGIAFNRMFTMKQYPNDIMPLYAQGYSLASFLIQKGGKRKFLDFLADGMEAEQDSGGSVTAWSAAIKRHYGIAHTGALQNTWLAWVSKGSPPLRRTQVVPVAQPRPEMLADHQPRPRPEPNLIHRINNRQAAPYAPGSVVPAEIAEPSSPPGEPEQPPSAGWYAAGTRPSRTPIAAATPPPSAPSIRSHVTRPQPFERPRQTILEWCAPGGG
jgi:hypothetical protein